MIVYHAITSFHILCSIAHKKNYHDKEEAVLILPDFITDKFSKDKLEVIVQSGLFIDILYFPYRRCNKKRQIIEEVARRWFKEFEKEYSNISKYYVSGAHFYFTIPLIISGIHYDVFEEATGAYSHR